MQRADGVCRGSECKVAQTTEKDKVVQTAKHNKVAQIDQQDKVVKTNLPNKVAEASHKEKGPLESRKVVIAVTSSDSGSSESSSVVLGRLRACSAFEC